MKKVTIITFPEYESLVLDSLGAAGVTQLKEVTGPDYDDYRKEAKGPDYKTLFGEIEPRYRELQKLINFKIDRTIPSLEVLRDYARNPDVKAKATIQQLDRLLAQLKGPREAQTIEVERITKELDERISKGSALYHEKKRSLLDQYARWNIKIELMKALGSDDIKGSLGYGVANTEFLKRLEQHLAKQPEVKIKVTSISPSDSFIEVNGPQELEKWVRDLFMVFDVTDITVILGAEAKTIIDPTKRSKELDKFQKEMTDWVEGIQARGSSFEEKMSSLETEHQESIKLLEDEKTEKLTASTQQWTERATKVEAEVKEKDMKALSEIAFNYNLLRLGADDRAPVMRTKVFSIMQGWTPEDNVGEFKTALTDVEAKIGEKIIVDVEDVEPGTKGVPTPTPNMRPKILLPTWKLTTLRGWPTNTEFNPAYISVIVFAFQFGLMYGDVGQGLIILILGFVFTSKFKRGMLKYLGGLFIPMGIAATIFGFLYGSFFLNESLLRQFYVPIMPNPIHQTTKLLLLVFEIAAIEIILGLCIGAYNQIKKGNPVGALGEHGLGMILYVGGLYMTAIYFISIKMNFMKALSYPGFYVMILGMVLSFAEPVIHSIQHGHGVGMESIGEGVGGLLMTFVEGLANLFSYLRIAAFALAHASLAIAADALNAALPLPIPIPIGLIIMNVVALSFELISSTVQSLRLLYYEFMGKFFDGQGLPFKPFTVPKDKRITE
ncbi:MAG: V-type ATPase 116kDa subunit family protein [Candidatus Bathyarchaeia archaeon]|jgi:vacuolar-type H+-ATPase subunit I/STV1